MVLIELRKRKSGMADGPLALVFNSPMARILDEASLVGNMQQTVSMIAESTELTKSVVGKSMQRLVRLRLVRRDGRLGRERAYRFRVTDTMRDLVKWMTIFQLGRFRHRD